MTRLFAFYRQFKRDTIIRYKFYPYPSNTCIQVYLKTISMLLQEIPSGEPPVVTDIFIDTVGDPEFYKSRLTSALGKDFGRFVIEKKADATYKVVSAASIIAKVTSERAFMLL